MAARIPPIIFELTPSAESFLSQLSFFPPLFTVFCPEGWLHRSWTALTLHLDPEDAFGFSSRDGWPSALGL